MELFNDVTDCGAVGVVLDVIEEEGEVDKFKTGEILGGGNVTQLLKILEGVGGGKFSFEFDGSPLLNCLDKHQFIFKFSLLGSVAERK